jgi:hypothetical protein
MSPPFQSTWTQWAAANTASICGKKFAASGSPGIKATSKLVPEKGANACPIFEICSAAKCLGALGLQPARPVAI